MAGESGFRFCLLVHMLKTARTLHDMGGGVVFGWSDGVSSWIGKGHTVLDGRPYDVVLFCVNTSEQVAVYDTFFASL